jgi:alanine-synthesizing transaminase
MGRPAAQAFVRHVVTMQNTPPGAPARRDRRVYSTDMFSRRLPWPVPPNRLARRLRDRRAAGRPILDLTETNPTRVGLGASAQAIHGALASADAASYDPNPLGSSEAREAIAAHYRRRGLEVPPGRIILTASTSEAYAFLLKLLADPGDRILVPRPSYPLFEYLAALESVAVSSYPLDYDGAWRIDLQALERAFTQGDRSVAAGPGAARAVVVVSPNNPTGSALREGERAALESIAARAGSALIADEVFFDFPFGDAPGVPPGARPSGAGDRMVSTITPARGGSDAGALRFTLGGLSKSCGMPQMKLGWIVAGGPAALVAEAIDRLELIADTYLSVGAGVQRAAARLLEIGERVREGIHERIRGNRNALAALLPSAPSCRMLEADGGWSAVLQVPAVVSEEDLVLALLDQDDTLVHPGYFFDFATEAYLVLSLLPEPEVFREGARRLLARASRG